MIKLQIKNQSYESYERARGFTLIEILVVMAIIGMLAVMVAPNIFNQQAGAQRDAALSQISCFTFRVLLS